MSIPDIGDYSIKKQQRQFFTPLSDNVIVSSLRDSQLNHKVELDELGEARGKLLGIGLDKLSDDVKG